ncbi:MAG: cold-shock protein [Bacteroidales bacterium]
MGRSSETYKKKEVRNKKEKKKKAKLEKKQSRKDNDKKSLDDMIAYVDENGRLSDTPPDPSEKEEVKAEDIQVAVPKSEDVEMDPIRKGVVDFFNDTKGFGFIKDSETKESVFVHINNVDGDIREGNLVQFEVEMGARGPAAANVKQIKEEPKKKDSGEQK